MSLPNCTGACLSRGCNCERPDPIPSGRERHAPVVGRVTFGPAPQITTPSERYGIKPEDIAAAAAAYTAEDRSPMRDEPCRYQDASVRTMVHILVEETPLGDVLLRKGYHFEADAKKACEQRQIECDAASALRGMRAPRFYVETVELEAGE